jgi:hypothetical protein
MLLLHVIIIEECIPVLHACYFFVAVSMLCSIVRSLPCLAHPVKHCAALETEASG